MQALQTGTLNCRKPKGCWLLIFDRKFHNRSSLKINPPYLYLYFKRKTYLAIISFSYPQEHNYIFSLKKLDWTNFNCKSCCFTVESAAFTGLLVNVLKLQPKADHYMCLNVASLSYSGSVLVFLLLWVCFTVNICYSAL